MGKRRKSRKFWAPMFSDGRGYRPVSGEVARGAAEGAGAVGRGLAETLRVAWRVWRFWR